MGKRSISITKKDKKKIEKFIEHGQVLPENTGPYSVAKPRITYHIIRYPLFKDTVLRVITRKVIV